MNIIIFHHNKKINGKEINSDDLDKKLEEMKIGEEDVIIIEFVLNQNENFFLHIKSVEDCIKCSLC